MKGFRKNKGVTLVELLAVFSIIAILATVSIAIINPAALIRKAHDVKRKADLSRIKTAMEDYYNDNGCFPNQTVIDNYHLKTECGTNSFGSWLPKWPCDPKGNNYILEVETDEEGVVKECPGWFKVYANLENKNDSSIPADWYSMNNIVLSGNYGVNQVNYGVSSTNINWNSVSSVDYSSILPTPTSIPVSYGPYLSGLVMVGERGGGISPVFNRIVLNYTSSVPTTRTSTTIIPTAEDSINSTITVNGSIVQSGQQSQSIALNEGQNIINIIIKSKIDSSQTNYKIVVTRSPSPTPSGPYLSDLSAKLGKNFLTLDKVFTFSNLNYSVNLSSLPLTIMIIPSVQDVGASVTVDSQPAQSGVATPVLIDSSPKTILIVVTSPDRLSTQTYKIIFSSPPYLSNLVLKSGRATLTLDPGFMSNIFEYNANANGAPGCVVIPTTNDPAVIKVNDVEVSNGIQSSVISLNVGQNIIKVEVNSTKYILNVTR